MIICRMDKSLTDGITRKTNDGTIVYLVKLGYNFYAWCYIKQLMMQGEFEITAIEKSYSSVDGAKKAWKRNHGEENK